MSTHGTTSRVPFMSARRSLLVLGVTLAGLLWLASSAVANRLRESGSFPVSGLAFGQATVEQSTGDLFVVDPGEGVVKQFAPAGASVISEIKGSETPAGSFSGFTSGVAVDESASAAKGDIYVGDTFNHVVDRFKPKSAGPGYEYDCQLSGPGGGCVKEGGTPTTAFGFPFAPALDSAGNVYVGDYVAGAVYEFDSLATDLGQLHGADVVKPFSVAVGPQGAVYVTNFGGDTVKLTVNASHEVASETVLDADTTGAVSVDPSTGDVFVLDAQGGYHVVKYGPAGTVLEEFANKGELETSHGIAYSAHDNILYVVDSAAGKVVMFAEFPELRFEGVKNVTTSGATLLGKVIPGKSPAKWHFEYGPTSSYGSSTPEATASANEAVEATLTGLEAGGVYHFRLVASNANGVEYAPDQVLRTTAHAGTGAATSITQTGATLDATIEPGEVPTGYHFAYGTTSSYGSVAPLPDQTVPGDGSEHEVSQALVGLRAGTTYHYAIVASSPAGTVLGEDRTFATPPIPAPTVSTGAVGGTGLGTATLSGSIDPHGWATTYHFQYGPTTAYGSDWPTVDVGLGGFSGSQPVGVYVENLQPGATYHYRLVASNGGGTTYGSDMSFTTAQYPPSIVQQAPVLTASLGFFDPEVTPSHTKHKSKKTASKHSKRKHGRKGKKR